jgi:hypothetical protein
MCGRVGGTDSLSGRILWNESISVASHKMSLEEFLDNVEGPSEPALVAAMALLTLLTVMTATTVMRPALRTITPNYMAAPIVAAGGLGPFLNHCSAAWAYLVAMSCVTVYWQLLANEMADEREKMRFEFLTNVCYTCCTFGCGKERSWPCTVGMNNMGSMMGNEFINTSTAVSVNKIYH